MHSQVTVSSLSIANPLCRLSSHLWLILVAIRVYNFPQTILPHSYYYYYIIVLILLLDLPTDITNWHIMRHANIYKWMWKGRQPMQIGVSLCSCFLLIFFFSSSSLKPVLAWFLSQWLFYYAMRYPVYTPAGFIF